MDRNELAIELDVFKRTCQAKGYIEGELYFDEAYPGLIPTSFIVKMMVKKAWMDTMQTRGQALDKLIDVLWETTTPEIRANVHVLSIYDEDEADLLQQQLHREAA